MRLQGLISWYDSLSPETLAGLADYYHEQARFRDPFNDVRGHRAIAGIFEHMFQNTTDPSFRVTNSQSRDNLAWLEWEFHLRMRKRDLCIEGTSRLVFGEDGRIIDHRDFWDATELFAHMAFIGPLVRLLKRKLSADHQAGANL